MNYTLYLMSRLLVDYGTNINGISFESLPYDEQYYILPKIDTLFEKSGEDNREKSKYDCICAFLRKNKNIDTPDDYPMDDEKTSEERKGEAYIAHMEMEMGGEG